MLAAFFADLFCFVCQQYGMADFAHGVGLISNQQAAASRNKEKQCQSELASGKTYSRKCLALLDDVMDASASQSRVEVNAYDTRNWHARGSDYPTTVPRLAMYLNNDAVRTALHMPTVHEHKWEQCRYVSGAAPDSISHMLHGAVTQCTSLCRTMMALVSQRSWFKHWKQVCAQSSTPGSTT
jgi:hypothetical protein